MEVAGDSSILKKNDGIRAVTGITSLLSIIGACLIIFSYIIFRDIRTKARLILLHLSLTDLGVGLANFVGDVVDFDRFYVVNNTLNLPDRATDVVCKAQAFLALYFTISSILWTCVLAVYMYFLIMEKNGFSSRIYYWISFILCYAIPLIVALWMVGSSRLGFSPYNSSGFCSLIVKRVEEIMMSSTDVIYSDFHAEDLFVAVFAYDLWIVTTIVLTAVVYLSTHCFIRHQVALRKISQRSGHSDALFNLEVKFLLIPIMFIVLRMWSLINNILFMYAGLSESDIPQWVVSMLQYLTGIGDSGQGAVNGFIFVLLTKEIRKRLCSCVCLKKRTSINSKSGLTGVAFKCGDSSLDCNYPDMTCSKNPEKGSPVAYGRVENPQPIMQESPSTYTNYEV